MWQVILIPFMFLQMFSPYSQIAILGDHHIWVHEGTEQFMSVDAIYWHPSYDYTTLDYDIMLMKLAHKVEFNENVKPIALPKGCPNAGDICTVSGWGNIYTDDGKLLLNITTTATKACFSLDKTQNAGTDSVLLFTDSCSWGGESVKNTRIQNATLFF